MPANQITCPKCASKTIYRIPSHREPSNPIYIVLLGAWLTYLVRYAIWSLSN